MSESKYWEECYQRASYYLWAALRGQSITGNDPISGKPLNDMAYRVFGPGRDEARAVHKALARFWLEQLRNRRDRGRR